MLVAVCQLQLHILAAQSLKEKRFVLQSLKTRIRQKFNVSISEVGDADKWQTAHLGIAIVGNERKLLEKMFNRIVHLIDEDGRAEVMSQLFELH